MTVRKRKIQRETVFPVVLAVTITWCSGFPASVPTVGWLATDKIGHFIAYGALATAVVRHPSLNRWPWLGCWWAIVAASAYGMGDEFRQSLTHGIRSPDWHDWVADTLGAAVAVTLYLRWLWYRRLMETPLLKRRKSFQAPEEVATKGAEVAKAETA
ncbi:MAG TPA: VanZ family protein [Lacunisphaera sp.]